MSVFVVFFFCSTIPVVEQLTLWIFIVSLKCVVQCVDVVFPTSTIISRRPSCYLFLK
jgi:hypothetical protein